MVSGPQPTPPWMDEKNEPTGSDQPDATLALRPLAQLCDSYILAQGPEGLYIIDQHAAHERIIFNSMKAELERTGLPSQGLLLPETMDLGPQESLAAMRLQARLERLGFRLEPFGGPTWTLRGIPATLEPKEAKEALVEILATAKKRLRDLDGAGLDSVVLELADTWLYSLSCRAAVKAGQRLDIREMESLIASMADTGSGGYCPHGRPSTIVLTLADLEKRFGRS